MPPSPILIAPQPRLEAGVAARGPSHAVRDPRCRDADAGTAMRSDARANAAPSVA
jgi:hypothetical protein